MELYEVSADVRYLDGPLAGLSIPSGFRLRMPGSALAYSTAADLDERFRTEAPIKAVGTAARYVVSSWARVEQLR